MNTSDWPAALEAMERDGYETPEPPPPPEPLPPESDDPIGAAVGIFAGVVLSALIWLGLACLVFGTRVVFGGG